MQELSERNEALERRLARLEKRLAKLEAPMIFISERRDGEPIASDSRYR